MSGSYAARRKRDPIYLVLENGRQVAVLYGGDPQVSVRPEGERAELDDGWVICRYRIADGERGRVENSHVAS